MRRELVAMSCALALIASVALVIGGPTPTSAQAAPRGPNSGTVFANDGTVGTVDWQNPSNAETQDNQYASVSLTKASPTSHYLKATGFNFSVPAGATIEGIVVEVDRYGGSGASGGHMIADNSIKLVKGGVIGGDDRSASAVWSAYDIDTYQSYGDSTDLWGLTWSLTDINSPGFGVVISAAKGNANDAQTAHVDHIRITVYYEYDQAPTDIALSNSSVAENQPVNTVVGTFSTTDPDIGDAFTYTLVSGTGDQDNTSFNVNGGSLRTSASFDYETKNSYSIRVRSTDQEGLWAERQFTISITNVGYDLSTGSTEGGSITTPGEGVFNYDEGTMVDLVATPDTGYRFVNWTGDVGTIADVNADSTNITMNGDYSLTADFIRQYDLSTNSTAGGSVTEPGEGVFSCDDGTVVDLIAVADTGYQFVNWTGDVDTIADVNAASTDIAINDNYAIKAIFETVYKLTLAADPAAGGTATDLTNASPYEEGAEVSIKAQANESYRFVNWTASAGVFGNLTAAETNFTMPAQNATITANFEEMLPPSAYPTVTTEATTGITTSSATLHADCTVGDFSPVQVRFAYKKSTTSTWFHTDWVSCSTDGDCSALVTGLSSNATYDFKAALEYNDITIEGTILQFTTQSADSPAAGCFIATAAYGTPTAKQLDVLRDFRDEVLLKSTAGSRLVYFYYRTSPPIANFISQREVLRTLVRDLLINPIVWVTQATESMWQS